MKSGGWAITQREQRKEFEQRVKSLESEITQFRIELAELRGERRGAEKATVIDLPKMAWTQTRLIEW